jgi:hypothetical protein
LALEESSPKQEVLLFDQRKKKASLMMPGYLRDMSKTPPRVSVHQPFVVTPDPLTPTPSTSSAMKTPENTEGNPDDPEQADGGDI